MFSIKSFKKIISRDSISLKGNYIKENVSNEHANTWTIESNYDSSPNTSIENLYQRCVMLFFEYLREFKQNLGYASGGLMSSIREKKPDAKNFMLLSI